MVQLWKVPFQVMVVKTDQLKTKYEFITFVSLRKTKKQ